jgi:hypothetical protein
MSQIDCLIATAPSIYGDGGETNHRGTRSVGGPMQHHRGTEKSCILLGNNGLHPFEKNGILNEFVTLLRVEIIVMEGGLFSLRQ